jgi:hypothetical protein
MTGVIMHNVAKAVTMTAIIVASAITFTGEALSAPWIREAIRSSLCAQGNLKKCKPHERPAPKAPAPKGKKAG